MQYKRSIHIRLCENTVSKLLPYMAHITIPIKRQIQKIAAGNSVGTNIGRRQNRV